MKQVILTIALMLMLSLACCIVSEDDGRKQRYARVTANYNKCIERVKRDYNPKTDDAIASIARCRHWAIMTTD